MNGERGGSALIKAWNFENTSDKPNRKIKSSIKDVCVCVVKRKKSETDRTFFSLSKRQQTQSQHVSIFFDISRLRNGSLNEKKNVELSTTTTANEMNNRRRHTESSFSLSIILFDTLFKNQSFVNHLSYYRTEMNELYRCSMVCAC